MSPVKDVTGELIAKIKVFPKDYAGKCYVWAIKNIEIENAHPENPNQGHYMNVTGFCSEDAVGHVFPVVVSKYLALEILEARDNVLLCVVEIIDDERGSYARVYAFIPLAEAAFGLESGVYDHAWKIDGSNDAELAKLLLEHPKFPASARERLTREHIKQQ
jgi:hypothetical protein